MSLQGKIRELVPPESMLPISSSTAVCEMLETNHVVCVCGLYEWVNYDALNAYTGKCVVKDSIKGKHWVQKQRRHLE